MIEAESGPIFPQRSKGPLDHRGCYFGGNRRKPMATRNIEGATCQEVGLVQFCPFLGNAQGPYLLRKNGQN